MLVFCIVPKSLGWDLNLKSTDLEDHVDLKHMSLQASHTPKEILHGPYKTTVLYIAVFPYNKDFANDCHITIKHDYKTRAVTRAFV